MLRHTLQRLISMAPVLLLVSVVVFLLIHLVPGDPAMVMLGDQADEQTLTALRQEMGLDQPLPIQYLNWANHVIRGDLGHSIRTRQPVLELVLQRLVPTAELTFLALLLAVVFALPLGVISAVRNRQTFDQLSRLGGVMGLAMPHFWLGILLIFLFSLNLRWLPASGYVSFLDNPGTNLKLMVMPAITVAFASFAILMRQTRGAVLDVLGREYVKTAHAKGLHSRTVMLRHAFRNALVPVITIIGVQAGRLMGGVIVTETIFGLPGMGRLAVDAILSRDYPIVQGVVLVMALSVCIANIVVDLLYGYLDPRIRY